jgi:hypothetical protein
MTDLSVPNSFTAGNVAVAADVNENFTEIETFINDTGVPMLQDGAVSTAAKIADGVLTPAKFAKAEIGVSYLSASRVFTANSIVAVHGTYTGASDWTQQIAANDVQLTWDAVNERYKALAAGRFRISMEAHLSQARPATGDLYYAVLGAWKNPTVDGTTGVISGGTQVANHVTPQVKGDAAAAATVEGSFSRIITLAANDYLYFTCRPIQSDATLESGSNNTVISIEYLGPSS